MSAGKFLAGFIVGGAVGALAGLLLAPKSGEETREMIAQKSSDIYDKTEASIKEIKSKTEAVVDDLQKKRWRTHFKSSRCLEKRRKKRLIVIKK